MVSSPQEPKHVACARCRDRKVKCDGAKPGCRRCLRNRTPCQYVRGRKQQTRSEWVQHLRTFSSQPGQLQCATPCTSTQRVFTGRANVTRSRPNSQPALPQTPTSCRQPSYGDEHVQFSSRPTSPYLFEHVSIAIDSPQGGTSVDSPFSSQTAAEGWNASCLPTSNCLAEPHSYIFEPSATYCGTNFTSDVLTTNSHALFPTYSSSIRSHTPVSQASETTSSYDGFSEL